MKILGIDPGYDRLGIAVVEKNSKEKEKVVFSRCLETSPRDSIYSRFRQIGAEISCILEKYDPDVMAIENLFITKNQKTAMRVSEVRGIIIYEAVRCGILVFEYSPMQIKTAITGDGTSDKRRMIKMLGLLVKISSKRALDDEYDAVAVALTYSACHPAS